MNPECLAAPMVEQRGTPSIADDGSLRSVIVFDDGRERRKTG